MDQEGFVRWSKQFPAVAQAVRTPFARLAQAPTTSQPSSSHAKVVGRRNCCSISTLLQCADVPAVAWSPSTTLTYWDPVFAQNTESQQGHETSKGFSFHQDPDALSVF